MRRVCGSARLRQQEVKVALVKIVARDERYSLRAEPYARHGCPELLDPVGTARHGPVVVPASGHRAPRTGRVLTRNWILCGRTGLSWTGWPWAFSLRSRSQCSPTVLSDSRA